MGWVQKNSVVVLLVWVLVNLGAVNARANFPGDTLKSGDEALGEISYNPEVYISPLPDEVNETSGLIFWRNILWTHNDSGGEPIIYGLDTTSGKIVRRVRIRDVKNTDWEDITQDRKYIYIGDFGNNSGMRRNLKIFKVKKSAIAPNVPEQEVDAEVIGFDYADQHNFEKRTNNHNFDCEAVTAFGDSLYLFTKDWADGNSRLYVLPKIPGHYSVFPRETFAANGLVTGACLSPDRKELALIGYRDYVSFMWLLTDFEGSDFFGGTRLRVDFPELVFVQTEGICYTGARDVVFSCEASAEPQRLYKVNTGQLQAIAVSRLGTFVPPGISVAGMSEKVNDNLVLDILKVPQPDFSIELRDHQWKQIFKAEYRWPADKNKFRVSISTRDLAPGAYFVRIASGDEKLIKKIEVKH